ncbi:hypothetical protein BB464_01975 [Helicobacter pylori]|nr:hypothetical protein BB464_01975 [Helicobacter pylori]
MLNKASYLTKTKNLLFNQNKIKNPIKRNFITLYRILQAYSDKNFLLVLLKNILSLFAFHSILV